MVKISVIIPCRNEEKYISTFLDSVLNSDYPKDQIEIFLVDGNSRDGTVKIIETYLIKYNYIKLLHNHKETVPFALNMAIEHSTGDYIIRLDAHCAIPANYFSELVRAAIKFKVDNVGTIWRTEVINKTKKSMAIIKVLSNKLGVGNSLFRIGVNKVQEVDTVPFGCFDRNVFAKVGLFNEMLDRDQDIELNKRIKKVGGKIILIPNVYSVYYARENFGALAKNNFATGKWNVLTIYITKYIKSISFRHLVPLFFLLSIIVPSSLMLLFPLVGLISAISIVSYLLLIFYISLKLKDQSTTFFYLFFTFIILHFSYGFGSLVGMFRFDYLFKKNEIKYL
jgi:glycosyltransferase involved in cell wall biosynthesis